MADTKISGLTVLTGANAVSGDLLTIVDISDTTMAATGTNKKITLTELQSAPVSAGTANGVLYLNGSKVATSGTALVFDGTNLGIGVASPTLRLQVAVSGATTTFDGLNVTNGTAQYRLGLTGASYSYAGAGANETWLYSAGTTPLTLGPDGNAPIKFVTNGSEQMRLTSTGLGIGTTSPGTKLDVANSGATATEATFRNSNGRLVLTQQAAGGAVTQYYKDAAVNYVGGVGTAVPGGSAQSALVFSDYQGSWVERARIDSSGNLLVGKTSWGSVSTNGAYIGTGWAGFSYNGDGLYLNRNVSDGNIVYFNRSGTLVGTITVSTTATAYNTSSDYRLKNIDGPLTGSGAFIDALKPKVGTWKADGSKFVGFLAHEVQEVSPTSVTGEKDGEQMQAMEYGSAEFIANIVAELQSLRKRLADAGIA